METFGNFFRMFMSNRSHAQMFFYALQFSTCIDFFHSPEFGNFIKVKGADDTDDDYEEDKLEVPFLSVE